MLLHCPACQSAFPGVSRCPRCGGLLLMSHEVSPEAPHRTDDAQAPLRPTAGGRVAIGIMLSLGLYLAVRKLVTGTVLATEPDPVGWWLSFRGLVAIHGAQVLAVVFGSVIAAAGRARGFPLGMAVGGVCGCLFLAFELKAGAPPRDLVLYVQPPVLALLGLIAGAVGARIWGAAPKIDMPLPNPSKLSSIRLTEDAEEDPGRPTAWLRILIGAGIMVIGVAVADPARHAAQHISGGTLRVQGPVQGEFITWQLAAFAVLLGGVVAAAGTGEGVWHGMWAGLLGAVGVLGLCANMGDTPTSLDFWLSQLSLEGLPVMDPGVIAGVAGGVLFASLLGGWLGGALFLPLAPEHMRRRLRGGMD